MSTENERTVDERRYLVFSPELRQFLTNNNISVADILAKAALPSEEAEETPDPSSVKRASGIRLRSFLRPRWRLRP
jgi:hypothetical protein